MWGPYNKDYLGASHIADQKRGLRFDLNLFPGYYRRSIMCPRDLADCGAKMMASSADLSHFVYRYELEWKDRVYVDADFCSDGGSLTVKCTFVNNTDMPESLTVNAVASMRGSSLYHKEIRDYSAKTCDDCAWVDAVDFDSFNGKYIFPADGLRQGERRESGFVKGRCISTKKYPEGFALSYSLEGVTTDKISIRYCGGGSAVLAFAGERINIELPLSKEITCAFFDVPKTYVENFSLEWKSGEADIDGFVVGYYAQNTEFVPSFTGFSPTVTAKENGATLEFGELCYEVETEGAELFVRRLFADDVGQLLSTAIHNHVSKFIKGEGKREYADFFLRPIFLDPHSQKTVVIRVKTSEADRMPADHTIYRQTCNPEGEKYLFSQNIMSATTLTNVVFPTYCRGEYIRHNTPGRNWDSLYTWDSGFIGMGLSTIDRKRAEDCLNAYLMPLDNTDSPFVLHGTPLPTQILLYAELVNKSSDTELAKRFYPRVKAMYSYFSKQKNNTASGIFSLWHLFYNSGGWDDYPTQKYLHELKKEESISPVVNTAFTILCAKILAPIARLVGEDDSLFLEDVEFFSRALNEYAWDEESGYYGYVEHENGKISIFKNMGVNADMGMDGAYPYIVGASDEYRSKRILENIKKGMMTDIGVSVVDTRAPYYSRSGYWNGSVWVPHQWILWKALLDYGETDLATEIAEKALSLWERETSATYNCYEHFMIENGRGAGFHQFSGLSTPVLMWFESYYKPYSVTSGFCTLVSDKKRNENGLSFKLSSTAKAPTVIVCLEEGREYSFSCEAEVTRMNNAAYALKFGSSGEYFVCVTEKK